MRSRGIILLVLLAVAGGLYLWAAREDLLGGPRRQVGPLYPRLDPREVDYLYLTLRSGQDLELQRRPGARWDITQPTRERAQTELVDVLLDNLLRAQAVPVESTGPQLTARDLGLEPPLYRITVGRGERRETLLLGEVEPEGTQQYARRAGDDQILLVPRNLSTWLRGHAQLWVDTRLLRGLRGRISGVRIEGAEGVVLDARRHGDTWSIAEPLAVLGDETRILSFVRAMQFLEQAQVVDSDPTPGALRTLGFPDAEMLARGELAGATLVELSAEGEDSDRILLPAGWRSLADQVPVVRGDLAKVVAVPVAALNALRTETDHFRLRRLLPAIEDRAHRLRLRRDGEEVLDIREEDGGWFFHAPEALAGERVDNQRVFGNSLLTDFLRRIDDIAVRRFTAPPTGEPTAEIHVGWTYAGSSRVDRVDLFEAVDDGVPARTTERPAEGLVLPLEVLDLFDPSLPYTLRSLMPVRPDPDLWAELHVVLPEADPPLRAVKQEDGSWKDDDLWGRRFGLAVDVLRHFRGHSWQPRRADADYPWSLVFLDEQGAELGRLGFRRLMDGEPRESLGQPAAVAWWSGSPDWELVVAAEWIDRFTELLSEPVRR